MSAARDIRIFIESERYEVEASIFSQDTENDEWVIAPDADPEPEKMQIKTVGTFTVDGTRAQICYDESDLTGMEGSQTCVSFDMREPQIVSMIRTGAVSTTLVFEGGKRHHCIYNTPYMPFEVCVHTLKVNNGIADGGLLELDYLVEIRGARAERTKFSMRIMD
jgi:uncharacterized beta-barrel protein YwiB (DUF1934 family)